jgi:hypothetical protein
MGRSMGWSLGRSWVRWSGRGAGGSSAISRSRRRGTGRGTSVRYVITGCRYSWGRSITGSRYEQNVQVSFARKANTANGKHIGIGSDKVRMYARGSRSRRTLLTRKGLSLGAAWDSARRPDLLSRVDPRRPTASFNSASVRRTRRLSLSD